MRKSILKRQLQSYCKEVYEKYNVVKEIDFNEDIDVEKSGVYFFDDEEKILRFMFQKKGEISSKDFFTTLGKKEETIQGVKLIPTENKDYCKSEWINCFLIEKKFNKAENDIFYFEFNIHEKGSFIIRFSNEYYGSKIIDAYNKKTNAGNLKSESKSKVVDYYFVNNRLASMEWSGLGLYYEEYLEYKYDTKFIRFVVNNKEKYILLGDEKLKTKGLDYINDEHISIIIAGSSIYGEDIDYAALIKSFDYGSSQGYLYLKPFKLDEKKVKVLILGNRDIKVQQYLKLDSKWVNVNKEIEFAQQEEIRLRVDMNSGDIIYKIIIIEDK